MWRHFSVVARPIWYSLHYNVQFSIRWVAIEAKLLKLNQIETKNLYLDQKTFQKILVRNCCVTSFFRRWPANLTFLALQCPIFNQRSTHESKTSQITPNSNKKPLTRSKGLLENISLNCCVTSFFRRCVANLTFLTLQCPIFNQFSVRICVWIWICVSNLCPGKCSWLSLSSLKIQMLISAASTKELHQICLKQKQPSEVF